MLYSINIYKLNRYEVIICLFLWFFVYALPNHALKTIKPLRKNIFSKETEVFIYTTEEVAGDGQLGEGHRNVTM